VKGREAAHGRNKIREVRSSGVQLPGAQGQEVLWGLLRSVGWPPISHLQLWTSGVCSWELAAVSIAWPGFVTWIVTQLPLDGTE
jgi:hypothetical protein